jgi:hypothetical protein
MPMIKFFPALILSLLFQAMSVFSNTALAAGDLPSFIGQKFSGDYRTELKGPECKIEDLFMRIEKTRLFLLGAECKNRNIILLSKASENGSPHSIIDQHNVRPLKKGEQFYSMSPYCYFGKKKDHPITFSGIFKGWKAQKAMTKKNGILIEGWIVDPKTEKIETLDAQKLNTVTCLDESEGET